MSPGVAQLAINIIESTSTSLTVLFIESTSLFFGDRRRLVDQTRDIQNHCNKVEGISETETNPILFSRKILYAYALPSFIIFGELVLELNRNFRVMLERVLQFLIER